MSTAAVGIRPAYSPRTSVYVVAALAMAAVIAEHLRLHPDATRPDGGMSDMPGMAGMPEMPPAAPSLAVSWGWWMLMSAAMMLPVVAVGADRIAGASLWRRRHVAVIEYLAGYLGVWSVFGLAAMGLIAAVWPAGVPAAAPAVALLAAAIWQITPLRKQAARRCARPAYVNVRGWSADRDCVIGGIARGRRCVVTCAPVMAVMALAHSVILMLVLTSLLLTERAAGPNPARRAGRPHEAIVLAGLAVAVGAWAALGRAHLP
jgi:predicted metal-binding membrane protein